MRAVIITIGDEILIGQVVDSNSAWIATELTSLGFEVYQIWSISDKRDEILESLKRGSEIADLVILTGGLGPTKDDITKDTLAEFFGVELEHREDILKQVASHFEQKGMEMPPANKGQALVPKGAKAIKNYNGTAPATWHEHFDTVFISLPGVPYEMKAMMKEELLPMIADHFNTPDIFHKTVWTQGIGESSLMDIIADWEESLESEGLKLAYLPQPGMVRLRITAIGEGIENLKKKVDEKIEELEEIIPEYIFGYEKDKLEELIGEELKRLNLTLSTAESCTGGYIAHLITSIPGSSAYFEGSVVSYANAVKTEVLGVNSDDIDKYGAVSEEVVTQMAKGVQKHLSTDTAISTSGVAGPDGGTDEKPVGTVWIGVAVKDKIITKKVQFGSHRFRNIRMSALEGLNMLRKELKKL